MAAACDTEQRGPWEELSKFLNNLCLMYLKSMIKLVICISTNNQTGVNLKRKKLILFHYFCTEKYLCTSHFEDFFRAAFDTLLFYFIVLTQTCH